MATVTLRQFVPSRLDGRHAFFLALLFGLTINLFLQMFVSARSGTAPLGALSTLLVMVGYFLLVHRYDKAFFRQVHFSDSLYYQGFMFTLGSLFISLYFFKGTSDSTQLIIAQNGVALLSTIFGLSARIGHRYFVTQTEDNESVSDEIDLLQKRVAQLSMEVERTTLDLSRLREKNHAELTATVAEASAAIQALTSAHGRATQTIIAKTLGATMEAAQEFSEKIKAIEVPPDLISKRIDVAFRELDRKAAELAMGCDKLIGNLENMEVPTNLVSNKLDSAFAGAEKAASNSVKALHILSDAGEKATSEIKDVAASLRDVKVPADVIVSKLAALELEPDSLQRRINSIDIPQDTIRSKLEAVDVPNSLLSERVFGLLTEETQTLTKHVEEVNASLARARKAVGAFAHVTEAAGSPQPERHGRGPTGWLRRRYRQLRRR